MEQLLLQNPWLFVCLMGAGVAVTCTAIVFVSDYFRKSRQTEIDAALKHEMLERGMSAAEIKTVLEASGDPQAAGNFNFQVELGGSQSPQPANSTSN